MNARVQSSQKRTGFVLIIVAGVLTVLAALVVGFYTMAQAQAKSALHYSDSIRARLLADAGVNDAIARLRSQSFQKTEDPSDPWFTIDYNNAKQSKISYAAIDPKNPTNPLPYSNMLGNSAGANSDRYTLTIEDASSKININAGDNLAVLLDNLCRMIGPPLVASDLDRVTPRTWEWYGATPSANPYVKDWPAAGSPGSSPYGSVPENVYYLHGPSGKPLTFQDLDPSDPRQYAIFGDGYAIAAYRGHHGLFHNIEEVKAVLTCVSRPGHPELEEFEREVKFQALKPYITIDSWVDTNTVCVGKFEWISHTTGGLVHCIDRDKSWIEDDLANDPLNHRGSLRGCYLSIVNGHGAGQLRRIRTNGIDWVEVDGGLTIDPGPTSSYMIIANEDAKLVDAAGNLLSYNYPDHPPPPGTTSFPMQNANGTLVDEPNIDYKRFPLCIHRAPVNINTASEKVLAALFLGINVQYGTFMALGTDGDLEAHREAWFFQKDPCQRYADPYSLPNGMGAKRTPVNSGRLTLDRPHPWKPAEQSRYGYINNFDKLGTPDFINATQNCNEAHELAYRIIVARQQDSATPGNQYVDGPTGQPTNTNTGLERKPFAGWDDLYFRVVRPWDDKRVSDSVATDPLGNTVYKKASIARMLMAHFNSNTDLLKSNPNIEWIDRWGRNFTEMEPVMQFTNDDWKTNVPFSSSGMPAVTIPFMHVNPTLSNILNNNAKPIFTVDKYSYLLGGAPHDFVNKKFGTLAEDYGSYVTRQFRYKADELIDKSDLNRSTTEFSFDSGGIYAITSVGQIVSHGQLAAEQKIDALVQVYDVWRETTQRQFAQGVISKAAGAPGTDRSGQVSRDADPANHRRALVTSPEPLVPLGYRIVNPKGNAELVDRGGQARDAWGNAKDVTVPDVVANRVLPAGYDGQLTLATNTLGFDSFDSYDPVNDNGDGDTFLASFNGDVDTDTSRYNGREQAKVPWTDYGDGDRYRVCQATGLLGTLNSSMVGYDPGLGKDSSGSDRATFLFQNINNALKPLNLNYYWNNTTCRMGDLRTDGVFLKGAGLSGRNATLKYLFGPKKENFDPGSEYGNCITMWMKPAWHEDDGVHHEFFNASNPGSFGAPDGSELPPASYFLCKPGTMWPSDLTWGYDDARGGGAWWSGDNKDNDLFCTYSADMSFGWGGDNRIGSFSAAIHGGTSSVPKARQPVRESPSYRVQPFRWHYIGMRANWTAGRTTYGNGSCIPNLMSSSMTGFWKKDFNSQNQNDALLFYPTNPAVCDLPYVPGGTKTPMSAQNPNTRGNECYGVTQGENPKRYMPFSYDLGVSVFPLQQYMLTYRLRPFIDTQRNPDWGDPATGTTTWKPNCFYAGNQTPVFWDQQGPMFATSTPMTFPPPVTATGKVVCEIGNSGAEFPTCVVPLVKGTGVYVPRYVDANDSFVIDDSKTTYGLPYNSGPARLLNTGRIAQDAKWDWADPSATPNPNKIFGINNLNYNNHVSVCRQSFIDGTYAVIDELKISNVDHVMVRKTQKNFPDWWKDSTNLVNPYTAKESDLRTLPWMDDTVGAVAPGFSAKSMWQKDRIAREQTTSRYYLDVATPPTFTSQSMLQSLKGFDKTAAGEPVTVVRMSWTVFTPRFLNEYKTPGFPNAKLPGAIFQRYENITHFGDGLFPTGFINPKASADLVPFKGPFDYKKYNGVASDPNPTINNQPMDYDDPSFDSDPTVVPYRCLRPKPTSYPSYTANKSYQANSGVEVELLNGAASLTGADNSTGTFTNKSVFSNPDVINRFGDPTTPTIVKTDKLKYRVRFKYPVDPLADPNGGATVDPTKHYLLDTPVFDDISIVYMTRPKILAYHVASE